MVYDSFTSIAMVFNSFSLKTGTIIMAMVSRPTNSLFPLFKRKFSPRPGYFKKRILLLHYFEFIFRPRILNVIKLIIKQLILLCLRLAIKSIFLKF